MNDMKRFDNESFEDYKTRRATDNKLTKFLLRGYQVWDSKSNGTLRKYKNRKLRHNLVGEV